MSKWKRTLPMMPPMTMPVWMPTRTEMSAPAEKAFCATICCIESAIEMTRLVASRWSSTQMKAPQHTCRRSKRHDRLCKAQWKWQWKGL